MSNVYLVTGVAGFIGFHLAHRLLASGHNVIGVDNLNAYYSVSLKHDRLERLKFLSSSINVPFTFYQLDISDYSALTSVFQAHNPTYVINLAAQAGVRYSIENPHAYINSNIVGFINILECCRHFSIKHLLYASSSSVYGGNSKLPFSESQSVDHPVSLYAATKKSNELMAHTYSHLYSLPTTGLRFFTVYGPWGRPDMALFLFTKAISNGDSIDVYNNGNMTRDFTYIDDIVESIFLLLNKPPTPFPSFNTYQPDPSSSWAPYRVFNIGNSNPTSLMDYINAIEQNLGQTAQINFLPMQAGDVPSTAADTSLLEDWISYRPNTSIKLGVAKFVDWYRSYFL